MKALQTPVEGGLVARLALGFSYPYRGARVVARDRSLLTLSLIPLTITAALYVTGLYFLFRHLGEIIELIWAYPEGEAWWTYILIGLWYLLYPVVATVALAAVYFSIIVVCNVVATPFVDAISEKVEALARGRDVGPAFSLKGFFGDIGRGLLHTLKRLLLLAAIMLPIVVLSFIGLGPIGVVLGALVASMFLTLEYLDPPMSRARLSFHDKRRLVLDNKLLCLGFGGAVYIILLLPLLAVFCIPSCVAGATLLWVDLHPDEQSKPGPDAA